MEIKVFPTAVALRLMGVIEIGIDNWVYNGLGI